jgi:hypothetical protein
VCAGDARAGALERSGPRPRGVLSPRARWASLEGRGCALERGGPHPRGREGLERGGPRTRECLSLERGDPRSRGVCCVALAGRGGPKGRGWAVYVLYVCELICVLRFLQVLSGFPPGYLGDP